MVLVLFEILLVISIVGTAIAEPKLSLDYAKANLNTGKKVIVWTYHKISDIISKEPEQKTAEEKI